MMPSLSTLPHTWLVDLDGTLLAHNGHLAGHERLLPGVLDFWATIPHHDCIILLSARDESYRASTLDFLCQAGIRFNHALFGLPKGERVVINDAKPSGLAMAHAINVKRDEGLIAFHYREDATI